MKSEIVILQDEINRLNGVLNSRIENDEAMRNEILRLNKRLCKHEGHLPITDNQGITWCEACQEKIGEQDES